MRLRCRIDPRKVVKELQFRVVDAVGDVAGLSSLFLEAAATERKLPAVYRKGVRTAWPDYPDENTAYGFTGEMTRLGPASAREVARYELAVELTGLLEPDERRLVWAVAHSAARRARGPRWRAIGKIMGVTPATVRNRYERAILGLWVKCSGVNPLAARRRHIV